jgi:WD40-like Beta Propeller Repeat
MRAHRLRMSASGLPSGARAAGAGGWIVRVAGIVTLALCGTGALAVLPATAAAEECPNAAFRTGPSAHLPDCRAYELVTPPFKNNGFVEMVSRGPEGSPMVVNIGSATAGTEAFPNAEPFSTGPAVYYSITRTASGWATVPQELPASEFSPATTGFTDRDGESLGGQDAVYRARRVGQPGNSLGLFMRRPDRSIVEVGQALPPTAPSDTPRGLAEEVRLKSAGVSADGSRTFFELGADFWPGDGTQASLPSLYEYLGVENTGPPLLVGVGDNGEQLGQCGDELGGFPSLQYNVPELTHNAVSADGNTVFFTVLSGCGRSAPPVTEVFARIDNGLPGAHTVAISEPSEEDCSACYENKRLISAGQLAEGVFVGASEDGSKVFFETRQPLLGGDSSNNIYEYDFDAPPGQRIVRVSAGDGTVSNPIAEVLRGDGVDHLWVQVSEDGSHVYFLANGVLTRAPNQQGESAEAGAPNLYVFERDAEYPSGRLAFITRLSPFDLESTEGSGLRWNVTPDGRFLVFTSSRDLTPDDTSPTRQLFEYDAQTGALVRVSIGQDGYNHNGNSPANFVTIPRLRYGPEYDSSEDWTSLSVSADGSYVFFESSAALTPNALEGFSNVYEYHDGQVSLISDGQDIAVNEIGGSVVEFLGTDASGDDVFFTTEDRLVGQDVDTSTDIYDARVDGGFPAPVAPSACVGEGCQGVLSEAPTLLSPGSEFQAGGNPPLAGGAPAAQPKAKPKSKSKKKKRGKAQGAKRRGGASKRSSHKRRSES